MNKKKNMNKKKKSTKVKDIRDILIYLGIPVAGVIIYISKIASKYPHYYIGDMAVWASVSLALILVIGSGIKKKQIAGKKPICIVLAVLTISIIVINLPEIPYYMDIPNFLNHRYSTVEGVISREWYSTGKYSSHHNNIIIDGESYIVIEGGRDVEVGDTVLIEYLPNSHIISKIKKR